MINYNVQTSKDIEDARRKSQLDITPMRAFIYGGSEEWQLHSRIVRILMDDPVFDKKERHFMSRTEIYRRALSMQHRIEELRLIHKWTIRETSLALAIIDEPLPMTLHTIAFEPVILSQGSPELVSKYRSLIANRGILGCYLQTELAHGTNVTKLETTATYLPASEEFEIHSPTLTSAKWWIGALGKTATHGIVQARLILPNGVDVGPHLFFVQLRSLENHKVLPHIQLGDIGPKVLSGYAGIDNGFAKFDHLRIPRFHMLSKFAQVTKEGRYARPPHTKLSYGGMLYIRSGMVTSAGRALAKAATISVRYATVRRQGNPDNDGFERRIIMYPSVHCRLFPILARAYVYILLGRNLTRSFDKLSARLALGDMSLLADMHAMTCGLKVLVTTTSIEDLETARRSMGGHGYSAFSGIGSLYANHLPSATYEGDNFVLDQQVARAALKAYKELVASPTSFTFSPFNSYLRHLKHAEGLPNLQKALAWSDWRIAVLILELRAARIVEVYASAERQIDTDGGADQRVSRAVSEAFVANQVSELIDSLPLHGNASQAVISLFTLYLLVTIENSLVDIMAIGLLPQTTALPLTPINDLRAEIAQLCLKILPEAVTLTDAFGYTDWELDSALGVYDGRVYEALWHRAQSEPLNMSELPDGYEKFIKPLIEYGQKLAARGTKHKL